MPQIDPTKLSKEVSEKYQIADNTFFTTPQENPKDLVELEIGDAKQVDFLPQVKLKRWDNEVNFSIRLKNDDYTTAVVSAEADKIKWVNGNINANFY